MTVRCSRCAGVRRGRFGLDLSLALQLLESVLEFVGNITGSVMLLHGMCDACGAVLLQVELFVQDFVQLNQCFDASIEHVLVVVVGEDLTFEDAIDHLQEGADSHASVAQAVEKSVIRRAAVRVSIDAEEVGFNELVGGAILLHLLLQALGLEIDGGLFCLLSQHLGFLELLLCGIFDVASIGGNGSGSDSGGLNEGRGERLLLLLLMVFGCDECVGWRESCDCR
mmetsp:Transcript_20847/g.57964  ORF Transcript_20847/g.57964 Transcript_20847/m.57964 type:complete len:225 (+) Transcript_20847:224-898(+)